jgi:hypothetical protein
MNRLLKIARQATPGTSVQFRKDAYGSNEIRAFLRDVIALANASVAGYRYIVCGVDFDASGKKQARTIDREDFSGNPHYQALVADNIEPPIQISYQPVTLDGKRVGVFEIGESKDRPYMMRIDHSEQLRRGDAFIRIDDTTVKMGRRQLQDLFHRKFRDAVPADNIEVGFPGEIVHKDFGIATVDLRLLPSAIAGGKLEQMMDIRNSVKNTGSTTVMARLTHARLFGSDSPYEHRSPEELLQEMSDIRHKHENGDAHFLFEENASQVQLVVLNRGENTIEEAALSLVLPNHEAFHVASCLPKRPRNDGFVARTPTEQAGYPSVTVKDDTIHISSNLGDLKPDASALAFSTPLRVCVGAELKGRKVGIRYALHGSNLQRPSKGRLRLLFGD